MRHYLVIFLTLYIHIAVCRDFYVGMFKKNDILVASDRLYKERVPFGVQVARYGRHFKCPITYFRVVDRLGMGRGPKVSITRGGLRRRYIILVIRSLHNLPISVNIYVGCENKMSSTAKTTTHKPDRGGDTDKNATTGATGGDDAESTTGGDGGNETTDGNSMDGGGDEATTPGGEGDDETTPDEETPAPE